MFDARLAEGSGRKRLLMEALVAAVGVCLSIGLAIAALSPLETVRAGTDQVLQILKKHLGNTEQRRAGIRKIVDHYFDFDELSKRALGPHWKQQTPAQQQEFTKVFSDFLFNVYIDKIEKYTDEKITYKEKEVKGDFALVDAMVAGSRSAEISIEYHLHSKGGGWKAYDVVIEGVGLVENYRSQFDSILSSGSFEDLLRQLREKNLQRK